MPTAERRQKMLKSRLDLTLTDAQFKARTVQLLEDILHSFDEMNRTLERAFSEGPHGRQKA